MRRQAKWLLIATLLAGHSTGAGALPESTRDERYPAELLRPYVPAVSMEADQRTGFDTPKMARRYGATGIVRCTGAVGTAQLTLRPDIITTAAHVLIDDVGQQRTCTFQSAAGGAAVTIEPHSIRTGSRAPLSEPATRDWAVARLVQPIRDVTPYGLTPAGSKPASVLMVAAGNKRADQMGAERCNARGMLEASPEGVREFAIDCNAAPGSSGAALTAGHRIAGIYVGYRSTDPARAQAFSTTHYNFAITVEGPFRRALLAAAAR